MPEPAGVNLHDDAALFREAVNFTVSRTGFNSRLVEKDYFCTLLLAHLARSGVDQLVFKGGTCLAKVHAGFYRLSEDLDFTIAMPVEAHRKLRRQAILEVKRAVATIATHAATFKTTEPLRGANSSTHYSGAVAYTSLITGQLERILIEVSIREPLLLRPETALARTVLLDPVSGEAGVHPLPMRCIALTEAVAEKFRAALSRREVAIRDFFDLHHLINQPGVDARDSQMIELVRRKLAVPGNPPTNVSKERLDDLRRQMDTQLRVVLRHEDFRTFELDRAIALVADMAAQL